MDPRPVASSYPAVTRNPCVPPVSAVALATLLLHMLGVATVQLVTPLDVTVTSLKILRPVLLAS